MSKLANHNPVHNVFGEIEAPEALKQFTAGDKTGATGISNFLNAAIILIYIIAAITVVFMLLWGAIEWILSGGDQEKLENAQKRITNAIIGIVLLAIVFAILQFVGIFTGFTFFLPKGIAGCDDIFYPDPGVNQCIHKYSTQTPCTYVFERVDKRFCGGKP